MGAVKEGLKEDGKSFDGVSMAMMMITQKWEKFKSPMKLEKGERSALQYDDGFINLIAISDKA